MHDPQLHQLCLIRTQQLELARLRAALKVVMSLATSVVIRKNYRGF